MAKRVLIMAEDVTLAHVARPVALAEGLRDHEVHLAVAPRFDHLLGPLPHIRHHLASINRERFRTALPFPARTLFPLVRPLAFALHTRPLNRVRPWIIV